MATEELSIEMLDKIGDKLEEHRQLALELADIKEREMLLRRDICDTLLEGRSKGTHNFTGEGLKIKAVKKYNINMDQSIGDIYDDLSEDEQECIRIKYEVAMKPYNAAEFDKSQLDAYIMVSPATPELTITLDS